MSKRKYSKRKSNSQTRQKQSLLTPILSFLLVCVLMVLAFYFGTQYNAMKNNTANQPGNNTTPEITAKPEVTQKTEITQPSEKESVTLTLYFPNKNADSVVPLERKVEVTRGESLEKVIFKELQKGPEVNGTGSIIPEGSKLLSAETKDGICYLNVSNEFVDNNPGGTAFEAALINSVVNSLTELAQVKKVQFLINGEKREIYTHMIFDEPFERNENYIRTSD